MPGQGHEELKRYATRALGGLSKVGDFLKASFKEAKVKAEKTADELKTEGEKAAKHIEETVIPQVTKSLEKGGQAVWAHASLTGRRVAAEAKELACDPAALEAKKSREFDLAKMVINQKVSMRAPFKAYLASDAAALKNFDNTGQEVKGVSIYPKLTDLPFLVNDHIPIRIYVSAQGLVARVYEQDSRAIENPKLPQYQFRTERPATADDLFQLQITAHQIGVSLDDARDSFRKSQTTSV